MTQLVQGTWVTFSIPPFDGAGRVCGISNTGVPALGVGYIIEINRLQHSRGEPHNYAYTHLQVFDYQILTKQKPETPEETAIFNMTADLEFIKDTDS